MLCFLSPADEGARAAGQTKRARPLLPLRRRADRASVRQTSSHGHGRVAGSPAEGQRGRPIAHHVFREGAPRSDQEPPRGQRASRHGEHARQGGQFTRSDPLSKPLPLLRHPPAPRLSGTQDLQVSGWDRDAYRQPCWSLSRVLRCFCFSLPLFFSTPGTSLPFVLLCPPPSPSSSSSFTSGTGPVSTWPDFVFTGTSGGPVQLREKAPCTEAEVGSRSFHTGQGSISIIAALAQTRLSSAALSFPLCQTPAMKKQLERHLPSPPTLDSIITEYLREQHARCPNPVTTCPPFSLFTPHRCPEPKQRRQASPNFTARLGARVLYPKYGGVDRACLDRHLIFSR